MNRSDLLDTLDKATDKAATFVLQRGYPIPVTKKSLLIGNSFVEKNNNGMYDVLNVEGKTAYKDISVFDVAIIVAQRLNTNEISAIKQVLFLEEKFSKYHTDMLHYLHCLKGAKRHNDIERMAILEDKFHLAELLAKNTRDKISIFKRVK